MAARQGEGEGLSGCPSRGGGGAEWLPIKGRGRG